MTTVNVPRTLRKSNKQRKSMSSFRASPSKLYPDLEAATQRSHARSVSSVSSASGTAPLRLADLAKQLGMGIHVDNWREDMAPVRQHLPLQHIIGSLKRDRDEPATAKATANTFPWDGTQFLIPTEQPMAFPRSEDSFLHALRTPKRRRLSASSRSDSQYTSDSDPDRRFSYQAAEHIAKDIPQSALPGLNHVLSFATITAGERDIFSEYAPKHLEDPQVLMSEALHLRDLMMKGEHEADEKENDTEEVNDAASVHSDIVSTERDAEVRKALEEFIDMNMDMRCVAKI